MNSKSKYFIVSVLTFLVIACSSGFNLFSDSDDMQLGTQFSEELKKNVNDYPVYQNSKLKDYINTRIFQHILKSPEVKKRNTYNYQLEIIDNDTTKNAFAVPGGYVYVYTGLLKYLNSEAALAGVLAHEIGHVERRHSTRRITSAYGISMVLGLALGDNPNQMVELAANLFTGLTLLANSRSDEDEADEFAVNALVSSRYYPGSVKFFFEKMKADKLIEEGGNGISTFLSTHPDPIQRIEVANQRMKSMGYGIKHFTDTGDGIYNNEYKKYILTKLR
ncbi:MAG: M48 family metalloprotease [Bacteroidetes bacterium]|nr:M48 family metalloprotease [Bacteroidota bacterium]